jgi:hypothetical protein
MQLKIHLNEKLNKRGCPEFLSDSPFFMFFSSALRSPLGLSLGGLLAFLFAISILL